MHSYIHQVTISMNVQALTRGNVDAALCIVVIRSKLKDISEYSQIIHKVIVIIYINLIGGPDRFQYSLVVVRCNCS
jgi:hypothetical protein